MRSSRLAVAAVAAGAVLLGWSTAGVRSIDGALSAATPAAVTPPHPDRPDRHHDDVDFRRPAAPPRPGPPGAHPRPVPVPLPGV